MADIKNLKSLLRLWQELTPEQAEKITLLLHRPQYYHIESLARELDISRTQVYRLKKLGIIPPPLKIAGFKEKVYTSAQVGEIKKRLSKPYLTGNTGKK